jgi:rfaE bifunctional protein nucleotidyltransferase chain/domain
MGMICTQEDLRRYLRGATGNDLTVVLTNGCFDLFHAGHLQTLRFAKKQGDLLVVAVNTDESIRTLKGPHRPIHKLQDRMEHLAELACVDYVVPFGTAADPSVEPLVALLKPDVLVKGGDYTRGTVVGGAVVEHHGGRVVIAPIVPGASTTGTITAMGRDTTPDLRTIADIPTVPGALDDSPRTKGDSVGFWKEEDISATGGATPAASTRAQLALVDLDGVLVDFFGSMARALNLPWEPEECRGEYDPGKIFGVPTDLFSLFGPDFWEAAGWMPDGREIWSTVLRLFGEENVYLCSSPTHESSSPMGKLRWIERNLDAQWSRRYIFTPCKSILATNETYLIDDCYEVVAAFCHRGGRGVLVPRPWNVLWDFHDSSGVVGNLESRIRLGFAHSEEIAV